jgi:glycogen(starch) synthase
VRVLMLSWEYPPVVVGGLGRHVHALATELAAAGHDVAVLSRQPSGTDAGTHPTVDEVVEGVRVLRVAEDPTHLEFERDMVAWTLAMGHALLRTALTRIAGWRPDVVHAHDWLVAHPAIALADVFGVPLVATIHATEAGRYAGWLSSPLSRQVHSTEWWLANPPGSPYCTTESRRGAGAPTRDASRPPGSGTRLRDNRCCCTSAGSSTRKGCRT